MADWVTISALASAGGTLVLAGVTVASVRSANRAARVAEMSLLAEQRPLLVASRGGYVPPRRSAPPAGCCAGVAPATEGRIRRRRLPCRPRRPGRRPRDRR